MRSCATGWALFALALVMSNPKPAKSIAFIATLNFCDKKPKASVGDVFELTLKTEAKAFVIDRRYTITQDDVNRHNDYVRIEFDRAGMKVVPIKFLHINASVEVCISSIQVDQYSGNEVVRSCATPRKDVKILKQHSSEHDMTCRRIKDPFKPTTPETYGGMKLEVLIGIVVGAAVGCACLSACLIIGICKWKRKRAASGRVSLSATSKAGTAICDDNKTVGSSDSMYGIASLDAYGNMTDPYGPIPGDKGEDKKNQNKPK